MVSNLSLGDGMMILDEAFSRTRKIMEGYSNVKFSAEEYQKFYECVYLLCVQRTSFDNSRMLYERYQNGLEECIYSLVLPSLEDKNDAALLTELVVKWSNYQLIARWLSRFFCYLDRFYIPRVGAFGLLELAIRCFHNLVNSRCNSKLVPAAIALINQDRNGEKIDSNILKNVVEYFDIVRTVGGTCYDEFEKALLADSVAHYSQVASHGLLNDSWGDYTYKVQWCLNQESERSSQFLNPTLRDKLLQVVKSCLVDQVVTKFAEKQRAENQGKSADYQDLLSKCADLNLGDPGTDQSWNMVRQP
ncbi:cullin-1-like [Chenopodium quinoa]|uniref:cullin-1-like n=1 Tax=Chenopodium quinoa TaxID=63459 RepID=UPI000B775CEF|nr:cullin-1-like [Chenopodium quinoa]